MFFDVYPLFHCIMFVLSGFTIGLYFGTKRDWEDNIVIENLGEGYYALKCKKVSIDCGRCNGKMSITTNGVTPIITCNHCDNKTS